MGGERWYAARLPLVNRNRTRIASPDWPALASQRQEDHDRASLIPSMHLKAYQLGDSFTYIALNLHDAERLIYDL